MKIEKVLDKLKELFPNDLIFSDIWENKNEQNIINIGSEGDAICFLKYSDIEDYINIESVTIRNRKWSISCEYIKPEDFFDLENSSISFHDFNACKKFIQTHYNFPRKIYYNNGILFYNYNESDNKNEIIKINDITKTKMIMKPVFIEE